MRGAGMGANGYLRSAGCAAVAASATGEAISARYREDGSLGTAQHPDRHAS
jgi:hypothetical protein